MTKPNVFRKTYLINKGFQLSFMFYSALLSFLVIFIFFAAKLYFFQKLVDRGLALGFPPDHVFFSYVHQQSTDMNYLFFIASGTVFVLTIILGLIFSNRVAGPIYRLTNQLTECSKTASLKEIQFRKKDYFPELAQAFNSYIQSLKK